MCLPVVVQPNVAGRPVESLGTVGFVGSAHYIPDFVLRNPMFDDDVLVIAVGIVFKIPDDERLKWLRHLDPPEIVGQFKLVLEL
jgi:hypothetical protein